MEGTQGRSSNAADVIVISVQLDVYFFRDYGARPRRVSTGEQDALGTLSLCEYCDYVK